MAGAEKVGEATANEAKAANVTDQVDEKLRLAQNKVTAIAVCSHCSLTEAGMVLQKRRTEKKNVSRKLNQRTKWGQPIMKHHMDNLLQKLQKDMGK